MGILGKFTSVKAITIMLLMGAVAFSSEVRADLTPSLSTVTGSGSFVFTYSVTLSSAERANTGAIPLVGLLPVRTRSQLAGPFSPLPVTWAQRQATRFLPILRPCPI